MLRELDILVKLFMCMYILLCYCGRKDVDAQGLIAQALFLGDPTGFNSTMDDCIWKRGNDRDACPDPDITLTLYTVGENAKRLKMPLDITQADWLRSSGWQRDKDNVILIHGYAGGDDALPMAVLRDAYIEHGAFNVFVADWGRLSQPPCYIAAVHNLRTVANCLATSFAFLRNAGMPVDRTVCVGHSLGAHICGMMSNYLNFRIERIIGLDPAKPLIRPGNIFRLDSGDAKSVQVIHTNAGYYGEGGKMGHVDFCVNGGRRQPFCSATSNVNLCSHIWSVCYLAQSIFDEAKQHAEPCNRQCVSRSLSGRRRARIHQDRFTIGNAIPMGHHTPANAFGSYCLKNSQPPFCPSTEADGNGRGIGDKRCCLDAFQ